MNNLIKNILIIEYNPWPISFDDNNFSGTTKVGLTLFNYLNSFKNYTCYYAAPGNHTIPNIVNYDELNYNISYDLIIINGVPDYDMFERQKMIFDKINKNTKYICICHGLYYNGNVLNTCFDKCIYVSKFAYDVALDVNDNKKCIIGNPIDISLYENLNIKDKKIENAIVISYNRSQGNIELFLDEIYPKIKNKIHDIKVYLCEPNYNCDDPNIIRNRYKNDHSIIFLGSIDYRKLIDIYMKCPISWDYSECPQTFSYNSAEHLLCHTFITTNVFRDATQDLCTNDYIENHNLNIDINNKDYDKIASFMIDHIKNYYTYANVFNDVRSHIMSSFNKDKIMHKYFNVLKQYL